MTRRKMLQTCAAIAIYPHAGLAEASPLPVVTIDSDAVMMDVQLTVNTAAHRLTLDTRTTVLDALREHLGLASSKKGAIMASVARARC